jgi:RimJ/RimL family protein N-acetyltransferase
MRAEAIATGAEFLERAGPLLNADEARHNLILALTWILVERPEVYPDFGLWVAEEEGRPVAAALMTPPHNLVLADAVAPAALVPLAGAVRASGRPVPGVVGNRPTVDRFNRVWGPLAGVAPRLHMAMGVFVLERVEPPGVPAAGRPRRALSPERALVLDWLDAFNAEALPEAPADEEAMARMVDHRLDPGVEDEGVWLWEVEDEARSLVAYGGPTPGGMRIGPVYTPPEHRRRGYCTALVAGVCARLLEQGRRRCYLFADLANPTSNAIYQRVGFQQVAESAEYGYQAVT